MKRMARSRPLTLYKIRQQIGGEPVDQYEDALTQDALARPSLSSYPLTSRQDFGARLFVDSPEPIEPSWLAFLKEGFGDLPMQQSAANGAVLVVRVRHRSRSEFFAFTFGFGRFLLRTGGYERSYGLRVALNTLYEADKPTTVSAPVRVRRVDVKTVAANTMYSSRQSNRLTSFDEFGLDVQRDILGGITGVPADTATWGARIGGKDALYLNLALEFRDLGAVCKRVLLAHDKTDYKVRFAWVDNIHPVDDPGTTSKLEEQVLESLKKGQLDGFELAPPDLIEWDDVGSFRYSLEPDVDHQELDLAAYYAALARTGDLASLDLQTLRTSHRIDARDAGGDTIYSWPVFECLDREIRLDQHVFLLTGGDFFEVALDYLKELDAYIDELKESKVLLPTSKVNEKEGPYNERASGESKDYLMLDRQLVRVDTITDPIEVCDILTSNGCLIHIKRKLSSSSLSHLFAQGAVSGDLLLMSRQFRQRTLDVIKEAARKRRITPASFSTFTSDDIAPSRHEIVYGIIEQWKDRSLTNALPFFSKVNLRRHAEDLKRMGYKVSYKKIDVPEARPLAAGRLRKRLNPTRY